MTCLVTRRRDPDGYGTRRDRGLRPSEEEWPNYVERLEGFFDANGITDADKKRSVFIAVVGPRSYNLLRNLVAPEKPKEKTLAQLIAVLTKHYNPALSEVMPV